MPTRPETHGAPERAEAGLPAKDEDARPALPFRARLLDLHAGAPEVVLHGDDARHIGVRPLDRVKVLHAGNGTESPAVVNVSPSLVAVGEVGLSVELAVRVDAGSGDAMEVRKAPRPRSVEAIRAKLDGQRLSPEEMRMVISDIARHELTAVELTAWAAGIHVHGMELDETVSCIQAMVETGERVRFEGGAVLDVHSIGGVPGNKYAPITVAIVAANGLRIPKTSSRAISSACGTADFMEVVTPVALSAEEIKSVTEKAGGTLAWGGGVNLAPADDEIIRVEYPLSLDPPAQLLASVLSKKLAVGATHVLIDIPAGPDAKVKEPAAARRLARDFITVGERVGLDLQCLISQGNQPLGNTIGAVLEIQEALRVLEGSSEPAPLVEKACTLAGRLLEMGGAAEVGKGTALARSSLADGRALAAFRRIIDAQGGDPSVRADDLRPGAHHRDLHAPDNGVVASVDNRALVQIARAAGAPRDKGAGIRLACHPSERVTKDQPMYTVYADHASALDEAVTLARRLRPFRLEGREVFGFID